MLSSRFTIAAVALLAIGVVAFAGGNLDYTNVVTPAYHDWAPASGYMIVDDVHRTTSNPLVGVDLIVFNHGDSGRPADVDLYIYANGPGDTLPSGGPVLLASYQDIAFVPLGHGNFVHYDLPTPLKAPADLWIGIKSDAQAVMLDRYISTPLVGSTHELLGVGQGGFVTTETNDGGIANSLGIATYSSTTP